MNHACNGCGTTGCRPTDYAGWRHILGRLLCAYCVSKFPAWMSKRV